VKKFSVVFIYSGSFVCLILYSLLATDMYQYDTVDMINHIFLLLFGKRRFICHSMGMILVGFSQ